VLVHADLHNHTVLSDGDGSPEGVACTSPWWLQP
jgi:predicted metal-dependent phosphoesterase TrpH